MPARILCTARALTRSIVSCTFMGVTSSRFVPRLVFLLAAAVLMMAGNILVVQFRYRGMIYIPQANGVIIGGPTGSHHPALKPVPIDIHAFYIDRFLVTNAEYLRFMQTVGIPHPASWSGDHFPSGEDDFPVSGVTYNQASAYAEWCGKRLPTEEEWEYAGRGTDMRLYPWGDTPAPPPRNVHRKVGSLALDTSPFGVQDMLTTGVQWTTDRFWASDRFVLADWTPKLRDILVTRGYDELAIRIATHPNMACSKDGTPACIRCAADASPYGF